MGCNCKNDKGFIEGKSENVSVGKKTGNYIVKFLGFLILLALLPIINVVIIGFMFKTLVLNKEVNLKSLLLFVGKKGKVKTEDDDDDDYDDDEYDYLTEDEVVMVDVEDITEKK
jgi:hypothetical protein